jgi:hypothetical protein
MVRAGKKTGLTLLWIGLIAGIGRVLSLFVAGFAAVAVGDRERTDVDLHGRVALAGAPGERVGFTITGTRSIGERWSSSDGLALTLDGERSRLVPPREQDWGDRLRYGNSTDYGLKIDADVVVPDAPVGTTLRGTVTGRVTYPEATGGGGFSNRSSGADVAVRLRVVTAEESGRLRTEREGLARPALKWSLAVAAATAGVILLVLGAWLALGRPPAS